MSAAKSPKSHTPPKRTAWRGPRAVAGLFDSITRKAFARRGFEGPALVEQWENVVGQALARYSCPDRIAYARGEKTGGTLHLKVENGSLAMELMHQESSLVERVNTFFGYGAISRIKIQQGTIAERAQPKTSHKAKPAPVISGPGPAPRTGDPDLDAALKSLGDAIAHRRQRREEDN